MDYLIFFAFVTNFFRVFLYNIFGYYSLFLKIPINNIK